MFCAQISQVTINQYIAIIPKVLKYFGKNGVFADVSCTNLTGYNKSVNCDHTKSIKIFWKKVYVSQMFSAQISQVTTENRLQFC